MHEVSLVMAVLETAAAAARRAGAARIRKVRLRVGELAGVDPDALRFAYDALTGDQPLFAGSDLEVEWVPVRVQCPGCGAEGPALPYSVACSRCGSLGTRVVAGEELEIADVEVERGGDPDGEPGEGGHRPEDPLPER
ncbi:MAG: hydrogenase maturation nickel metallochaperone HypA [Firmicutes bacterium]|nr:hydrogenase maturation nickel metallochaperone HypA [Bacillota bacterium]